MRPARGVALGLTLGLVASACELRAEEPAPYMAFDSRLTVEPLAKSESVDGLVDLLPLRDGAVFLFRGRLVARTGDSALTTSVGLDAEGIAQLGDKSLWLASPAGVVPWGTNGPEPPRALALPAGARLRAAGTATFLQARQQGDRVRFHLRKPNGASLCLAEIPGTLRCFDWNTHGMAAVVGTAVYLVALRDADLDAPSTPPVELRRLDNHPAYAKAVDVAAVSPDRVLVALPHTVLLLSPRHQGIVVGMAARMRVLGDAAVLLNISNGVLWRVAGFDKLGPRDRDEVYANKLLAEARTKCSGSAYCREREEAKRLLTWGAH